MHAHQKKETNGRPAKLEMNCEDRIVKRTNYPGASEQYHTFHPRTHTVTVAFLLVENRLVFDCGDLERAGY